MTFTFDYRYDSQYFNEYDAWQRNEDYQGNELFGWQIEHRLQELQIELAQEDEENLVYQTWEYL